MSVQKMTNLRKIDVLKLTNLQKNVNLKLTNLQNGGVACLREKSIVNY